MPIPTLPVNFSVPANILFEANVGTLVVSRLNVVAEPRFTTPPPVRSVPAVTVRDGCCNMVFVIPALGTLKLTVPLVPPPVRPAPAVTPVIVPVPAALQDHVVPLETST